MTTGCGISHRVHIHKYNSNYYKEAKGSYNIGRKHINMKSTYEHRTCVTYTQHTIINIQKIIKKIKIKIKIPVLMHFQTGEL
jgi:hypothetical protein